MNPQQVSPESLRPVPGEKLAAARLRVHVVEGGLYEVLSARRRQQPIPGLYLVPPEDATMERVSKQASQGRDNTNDVPEEPVPLMATIATNPADAPSLAEVIPLSPPEIRASIAAIHEKVAA